MFYSLYDFLILIPFYLIGAFPTGLIIAKIYHVDIKSQGSGNVGATNVARTLGKKAGLFTLLGDVGKGIIALWLASFIAHDMLFLSKVSFIVVLGHCFSLPKLKGGKGVATTLGTLLAFDYKLALLALFVFIMVFYYSRIVSLASIIAALFIPIIFKILNPELNLCSYNLMALGFLVIYRHKENIKRLVKNEEKKFSFKK